MLNDCFIRPSGLYLYPSGESSLPFSPSSLLRPPSGVMPVLGTKEVFPPLRLPSISRYVRKLPDTLDALQDFPSVHLLIPASRSSQTNTEPDLICCLSFSESLLQTRGRRPRRHASNRVIASAGLRIMPTYVSIPECAMDCRNQCIRGRQ